MLLNEKSPWYHLKKLGFTWLIHFDFNCTSSLLSRRSVLRTTVNKDHKSTREMNLAIKRQEEWGNSLVANSRSGNVIPPATLSSVGTRTVVFTLTSDIQTTDQSNARSRKIYSVSGNLSCLCFCNLFWEMSDQFLRAIKRMARVHLNMSMIYVVSHFLSA